MQANIRNLTPGQNLSPPIAVSVLLTAIFVKFCHKARLVIHEVRQRVSGFSIVEVEIQKGFQFGVALLYSIKALDKLTPANNDQKVGIDIIRKAIQAPLRQIADNAGVDGAVVAGKLLEQNDTNYGYNAQNDEYTDMIKAGIVDPTKVVRTALQDAASVSGLLITTEACITEIPQKECSCGAGAGAGAMGPGAMGF